MLSIDLIRDNLRRSEEIVLARIEDMRDHCMVFPTPRGRVRAATNSLVDSLSEDDLDQVSAQVPDGVEGLFGTHRSCLQYAADHWFMHRGQLADARRAAGLDRMWF